MSKTQLPEPDQVLRAIDVYLDRAYGNAPGTPPARPSAAVRSMVEQLRTWQGDLLTAPAFVRSGDAESPRFSLRLGNRFYPHMKLVVEPSPNGQGYLFRADTHDRHISLPPDHPEYEAIAKMRRENQQVAEAIEAGWQEAGIPTFKSFLREDLSRRQPSPPKVAQTT
ncbi:hypothetical protein [Fontivita pretiosa]|jgi:hypothetical protein|uniref:hypothetical protein n=1 Tax=Fontivita pretiosa TaxID=2989684 RepID=UPI003D1754FE